MARNLNGTSDQIDLSAHLVVSGSFSLSGWIFPTSTAATNAIFGGTVNGDIEFRTSGTNLEFLAFSVTSIGSVNSVISSTSIWYQVGLSYDQTNWVIYVNGVSRG